MGLLDHLAADLISDSIGVSPRMTRRRARRRLHQRHGPRPAGGRGRRAVDLGAARLRAAAATTAAGSAGRGGRSRTGVDAAATASGA